MSNLERMRKLMDGVNRHETEAPPELFAENMVYENPALPGPADREGMNRFHVGMFAGFPDAVYKTQNMMESGDIVVTECTVEGTHTGEFAGMPATNRKVRTPIAFVVRFKDGKVRHWKSYYDQASRLRQLGAMP